LHDGRVCAVKNEWQLRKLGGQGRVITVQRDVDILGGRRHVEACITRGSKFGHDDEHNGGVFGGGVRGSGYYKVVVGVCFQKLCKGIKKKLSEAE